MGLRDFFGRKTEDKAKRELIESDILRIVNDAAAQGRFSLFMCSDIKNNFTKDKSLDTVEFFYDLCKGWDEMCNIPLNFGLFLDELSQDESVVVGLHRTNIRYGERNGDVPSSNDLVDMMENGLINYGHANAVGGSAFMKDPPPSLTFSPLKGITGYINLVGSYNGNNTVVLACFPSELVDDELGIKDRSRIDELYDMSGNNARVRPEHMMGAIIKNNNGLDEVFTKEEILSSKLNK
ncbi:MAG: hypothetical protein IKQ35_02460 [Bacilli bacterium]|nr:hypothetical protein [Bacilli bacterium]